MRSTGEVPSPVTGPEPGLCQRSRAAGEGQCQVTGIVELPCTDVPPTRRGNRPGAVARAGEWHASVKRLAGAFYSPVRCGNCLACRRI
jgi:hypothetical protein